MITLSYVPSLEHQACASINLDLGPYIQAIEKKIASPDKESLDAYEKTFECFVQLVQPIVCELRWTKWFETALQETRLTPEIILLIKQSPAYKILSYLTIEIIKNSMDECLFAYFDPLSEKKSHMVQLLLAINLEGEQVHFQFRDRGRGFPESFLSRVQDNAHKAQYLCQSDSHRRHDIKDSDPLFRSFGGHGIGLRELISLVHCDQHFLSLKSNVIESNPENARRIIEEGMASNYRVEFYNQTGACIRVVTPYSEHQVRDKSIVLPAKEAVPQTFEVRLPSFKRPTKMKLSIWLPPMQNPSDESEALVFKKA